MGRNGRYWRFPARESRWVKLSKPQALDNAEKREEQLRSVWLRLWRREPDKRWSVQPWPQQMADRRRGLVQYEFDFRSQQQFGQYYLQVGGPTMQWRLVTLPADDICVLITGAAVDERRDEADSLLDISVTSKQHDAEVLLGYLARGETDQAGLVSEPLIAGELLHGTRKNPTAAAVAGYFLLETANSKAPSGVGEQTRRMDHLAAGRRGDRRLVSDAEKVTGFRTGAKETDRSRCARNAGLHARTAAAARRPDPVRRRPGAQRGGCERGTQECAAVRGGGGLALDDHDFHR